jgi:hypothetical protein
MKDSLGTHCTQAMAVMGVGEDAGKRLATTVVRLDVPLYSIVTLISRKGRQASRSCR